MKPDKFKKGDYLREDCGCWWYVWKVTKKNYHYRLVNKGKTEHFNSKKNVENGRFMRLAKGKPR